MNGAGSTHLLMCDSGEYALCWRSCVGVDTGQRESGVVITWSRRRFRTGHEFSMRCMPRPQNPGRLAIIPTSAKGRQSLRSRPRPAFI